MELTKPAVDKLRELIHEEQEGTALRVAVRPGGCAGYSYDMYFDVEIDEKDTVTDLDGVLVAVDPTSELLLAGAMLDYKTGLESGFHITNPNAQRTCGCGSSFS